jgi:hypothetical protein
LVEFTKLWYMFAKFIAIFIVCFGVFMGIRSLHLTFSGEIDYELYMQKM